MQYARLFLAVPLIFSSYYAVAGGPVPFGGWVVNSGAIDTSASCNDATVQCKTLAEDDGFVYEEVTVDNYKYLRLVLTDEGVSGGAEAVLFSSETFVPFALQDAGDKQGIAAHQVLRDPNDGYELTADIQKAQMRLENAASAEEMYSSRVTQRIAKAEFSSEFSNTTYTQFATSPAAGTPDTSEVIGRTTDIDQSINVDANKRQRLIHRQREGVAGTTATPWSDGFYFVKQPVTAGGSVNLGGVDVSWQEGDKIATTWLVQENNVPDEAAIAVNIQSFENLSNQVRAEDGLFNVELPADPFAWSADLGVQPSFP